MKIGLFGGSFDPVHKGHLKLAQQALKQIGLAKVYWVVARQSPHKKNKKPTSSQHRIQMLRYAIGKSNRHRIATWELKRSGPSYTVTTLKHYKKAHPRDNIYFIMGSDTFKSFGMWKSPDQILNQATLIVGLRPGAKKRRVPKCVKEKTIFLSGRFPDYSSTRVRKSVGKKGALKNMVPKKVAGYIYRERLYQAH